MSRGANRDLPPLELNGIRYEQIVLEQCDPMDRRSGWMRARDIATGTELWELQVYPVSRIGPRTEDGEPMVDLYMLDCFFERFEFMPDQEHILVKNEYGDRYLVNIHTRAIRPATDDDFPPEKIYQRRKPRQLEPVVIRNTVYYEDLDHFFLESDDIPCGYLIGLDIKTQERLVFEPVYEVPMRYDLEHYVPECYFSMMFAMPGRRDLCIHNQDGEIFFYDVRARRVWRAPPEIFAYAYYEQVRQNWRARLRFFFLDIWDWLTRRRY